MQPLRPLQKGGIPRSIYTNITQLSSTGTWHAGRHWWVGMRGAVGRVRPF